MSSERQGEHPSRAFGSTGGGFAEGDANPEEFPEDKKVGSFATGEENPEEFPEDEKLGSFARGEEEADNPQDIEEGTFGTSNEPEE